MRFAAALVLLAAACTPAADENEVLGDSGKLLFKISGCLSCVPAGYLANADREHLYIDRLEAAFTDLEDIDPFGDKEPVDGDVTITSDDERVLAISVEPEDDGSLDFVVTTGEPGDVRIVVSIDGDELDATTLHVGRATSLVPFVATDTREPVARIELAVGEEVVVHVAASDERGLLTSDDHYRFAVDDVAIASIWSPSLALVPGEEAQVGSLDDATSFAYVRGEAAGATRLTVGRDEATAIVDVVVR